MDNRPQQKAGLVVKRKKREIPASAPSLNHKGKPALPAGPQDEVISCVFLNPVRAGFGFPKSRG
jgi:hypothetical protein